MSHRYGRHGPRAWLRRRKRRHRPFILPAIAQPVQPETRVIRVHIPIGISAERIILIIMQNNGDFEVKTEEQRVVDGQVQAVQPYASSLPDTEHRMPSLSSADNDLRENAKIEAMKDLRGFNRAREHGEGVAIDRKSLEARAEALADKDLGNYRSRHSITFTEYKHLFDVYRHTYLAQINEALKNDADVYYWLENKKEAELRAQAIKDKNMPHFVELGFQSSGYRRDLGVLRVMVLYNIDLDQALDDLERLHKLVNKYDDYQKRSGKEVIWPDLATFQ